MRVFTRPRRFRYVVDRKLQGSLIGHGLAYGAAVLAAIGFGIFAPLLWGLGDRGDTSGFEEQSIVMIYLHDRFWIIAALALILVVVGAIRYSHRVAGPLVRFKRNLKMLGNGQMPPPLRTRRSDFLKEEVCVLNRAVAGVSARVDAIKRANAEVCRRADAVAETAGVGTQEVEQLLAACEQLRCATETFSHVETADDSARPSVLVGVAPVGQPGGV